MKRFFSTLLVVITSVFGIACLSIAAAAFKKSSDPLVIRNGFHTDYITLTVVFGVIGILALVFLVLALLLALRQRKPAPPAAHF